MSHEIKRNITDYLDTEYASYALYVIEGRAVPSVIDGFKPVQRKIIHVARKVWKGEAKPTKVFMLAGKVASDAFYHHGDSSLNGAIISMAQKFKNNLPLLEDIGQFGSLRSPESGAPRYISTKLSENFKLLYRDDELLTYKQEEGYTIEPEFFLPIIPTVLINGGSGVAVGYSSNILNRKASDVVNACLALLRDKKFYKIKPYINEFNGTYEQDPDKPSKWFITGDYEVVNTTTVHITELPPSMTYENFEKHLDELIEKQKIKSYEDNSKDNIDYTIKMSRDVLEKLDHEGVLSLFKLRQSATEHYTTLDENGKLKIFESAEDIVKYFVNFRLNYYQKRKDYQLAILADEIVWLDNKAKFILAILEDKIIVNKRSKDDIIKQIKKVGIDEKDGSYDYLLRMPINSLTKEMWEKLKEDQKLKKDEHKVVKASSPKDIYIEELEELKKKV